MHGLSLYVGCPGTGKTHDAIRDVLRADPSLSRVILDLGATSTLSSVPLGQPFEADIVRVVPESAVELDAVLDRVFDEGNAVVLVDDMNVLASNQLERCARLWRSRNLRILATTHHVSGDVGQVLLSLNPVIFAYRTTSPTSLDWFKKWHRVDPDRLRTLPIGECLELWP